MECPCCSNRSNKCLDSRVGPDSERNDNILNYELKMESSYKIKDNINYENKSVEPYSIKRPASQGPQMYYIDNQGPSPGNYK